MLSSFVCPSSAEHSNHHGLAGQGPRLGRPLGRAASPALSTQAWKIRAYGRTERCDTAQCAGQKQSRQQSLLRGTSGHSQRWSRPDPREGPRRRFRAVSQRLSADRQVPTSARGGSEPSASKAIVFQLLSRGSVSRPRGTDALPEVHGRKRDDEALLCRVRVATAVAIPGLRFRSSAAPRKARMEQ